MRRLSALGAYRAWLSSGRHAPQAKIPSLMKTCRTGKTAQYQYAVSWALVEGGEEQFNQLQESGAASGEPWRASMPPWPGST